MTECERLSCLLPLYFFKLVNRTVLLNSPSVVGDLYGFQRRHVGHLTELSKSSSFQLSAAFKSSFLNQKALGRIQYIHQSSFKCLELFFSPSRTGKNIVSLLSQHKTSKYFLLAKTEKCLLLQSVWGLLRTYSTGIYWASDLHIFSCLTLATTLCVSLSSFQTKTFSLTKETF